MLVSLTLKDCMMAPNGRKENGASAMSPVYSAWVVDDVGGGVDFDLVVIENEDYLGFSKAVQVILLAR